MCRPSRQVERLGPPKAPHPTRNGAAVEGHVGVKRLKARTASDDAFKNKLGRKTFARFDDALSAQESSGRSLRRGVIPVGFNQFKEQYQ
ncbi:MAG: hypothetical protein QG662_957 [Pseudomonadota bacterium]|nr:hypothetical protein [Pseudomonadota bacterium]